MWREKIFKKIFTYVTVSSAVVFVVLHTNISESLANRGSGFISSQNAFARSNNVLGNVTQLFLQSRRWVVEVGRHFESKYGEKRERKLLGCTRLD